MQVTASTMSLRTGPRTNDRADVPTGASEYIILHVTFNYRDWCLLIISEHMSSKRIALCHLLQEFYLQMKNVFEV